jgi:hypothetical protein
MRRAREIEDRKSAHARERDREERDREEKQTGRQKAH